jgi:virginiamycin B lyase
LALALAVIAMSGCGGASSPEDKKIDDLQLPRGAYPSHLYLAHDGSLWITESAEAVARRLPDGEIRQYRLPGDENSPGDLEEGPDGVIWIAGFEEFIRIDPHNGAVGIAASFGPYANPAVGLPTAVAAGPDGRAWIATEGAYSSILRVTPDGEIEPFSVEGELGELDIQGAALGPDDGVWLTLGEEFGGPTNEVARLAENGSMERWALPGHRSAIGQIVAGPDERMWFTEPSDHRIGSITMAGEISEFRLRPGLSPNDIASGRGDCLWFTTDKRVGRIATDGQIETWLVPGADSLFGVAPALDGGVWMADGPSDRVRYFHPSS